MTYDDSRARAAVSGYLGCVQIADPNQSLEGWVVAYTSDWWSASKSADLLYTYVLSALSMAAAVLPTE